MWRTLLTNGNLPSVQSELLLLSQYQFTLSYIARKRAISAGNKHVRCVSTWSPLATAFNSKPARKSINFNLVREDTGLFGIPELKIPEGFYLLKENAIVNTDTLVQESQNPGRSRKMVEVFDHLSDTLCQVADLAEFVRIAHPQGKFARAAEDACISISGEVERLNTHRDLYLALKSVVKSGDSFPTTEVDTHVSRLFLFDFEQSGIHLPEKEREQVVQLNDSILHLGQQFMARSLHPRAVPKTALPETIRNLFSSEGSNILVTGLYADSSNDLAREAAYKIFLHPDSHQEALLSDLLECRFELARLCGFPTYRHRAIKASLAETPEVVDQFLDILTAELKDRAADDFNKMSVMKRRNNPYAKDLSPWDTPYFTGLAKREWLQSDSVDFSPYFSLGACMEGLDMIFRNLYGISLVHEEMVNGESWALDVYKVAVVHENEGLLGHIYCDFYERPNKPNQDCHFTVRGGKELSDGKYQNPIVVLMLNFPPPSWTTPSLLTPGMVDNLFHEMGHAMHSMLARTQYQHVTGTRCSTDFAEVPSVLMEYFASDPRVISKFARHYRTQEEMPFDKLSRLCAAKSLFTASETQLQVFYSMLDQKYHDIHPLRGTTTDVLAEVQAEYYGIPHVPMTAWQLRFSHLVGYGAKYYAYLMSRAVAAWIWQQCFQEDPFSRAMGERYRRECLAHGGGKPPHQLISSFLCKEATPDTLAQSLIADIDNRRTLITDLKIN